MCLPSIDSAWTCPVCTFVNTSTASAVSVCNACGSHKDNTSLISEGHQASSNSVVNSQRKMQRQKSISVESRRKRDEMQGKEQWNSIVKYCRDVSLLAASEHFSNN